MKKFIITANDNPQSFQDIQTKDAVVKYEIDFSPWCEDNADISTVVWTVKSGTVTIDDEAESANVATATLTFPQSGGQLVQVKATDSDGNVFVAHIEISTKDPYRNPNDYGFGYPC